MRKRQGLQLCTNQKPQNLLSQRRLQRSTNSCQRQNCWNRVGALSAQIACQQNQEISATRTKWNHVCPYGCDIVSFRRRDDQEAYALFVLTQKGPKKSRRNRCGDWTLLNGSSTDFAVRSWTASNTFGWATCITVWSISLVHSDAEWVSKPIFESVLCRGAKGKIVEIESAWLVRKLLVCKIKILLPVVQGEIMFACADVISDGFADGMINSWHVGHAKTLLSK